MPDETFNDAGAEVDRVNPPDQWTETKVETENLPATARIRAFEDEHLGEDCVRINGRVERGSGSPFAALDPELKRQYAALEKLVEAEQKLADAHAALIQAEADHEAALAAAEPKPDAEPE